MKRIYPSMQRINTRITPEQHKFIKAEARNRKRTEGEIFRLALDFYINQVLFINKK